MARTPTQKTVKRAESIGDPGVNAMPTARAADALMHLMLLSGAGMALARTGSELVNRIGRSRSSSFYDRQRKPNIEARVQSVPLPYVTKGAQDPGDSPGGGIYPRPRGRAARLGRNIDPAANMRALNAKPLPADPGQAAIQRARTIAANLAKTQANRARPGYAKSFARTNVNPIGQVASNLPPPVKTVVASGAKPTAAAPATGPQPLGPAFGGPRPAPMLSSRIPAPSPRPAAQPLGLASPGAASPRPLGLAPAGGATPAPTIPPRMTSPAPRTAMFGYSPRVSAAVGQAVPSSTPTAPVPAGSLKLAEELGDPSTFAQMAVKALGLTGDSSFRHLVNPTNATSLAGMPWFLAAAPGAAILGAHLGYKPVDMAFQRLRKSEDRAELDEVKERYHNALRASALTKAGSANLDAAYEAAEKRGFLGMEVPLGILALTMGSAGAAGAYQGWNKERKVNSAAVLDAALKQRHAELLSRMPRSYVVRPEAVTPMQQRKALRALGAAPDVDEDL